MIEKLEKYLPDFIRLPVLFVVIYLVLVIVFGLLFYASQSSFSLDGERSNLNLFQALYFSVVTITTLGYGEIVPVNWWGRLLVMVETLLGVFCFGLLLTSIGYSLGNRQIRHEREYIERQEALREKIGIVRVASVIQTFIERYDDNQAPMGMSGGTGYFFRDAGSVMSRPITFDQYRVSNDVSDVEITPRFTLQYTAALDGFIVQLDSLFSQHRTEISDYSLLDSIASNLHFCRVQSQLIVGEAELFHRTEQGEFVKSVVSHFGLALTSLSELLGELLSKSDYSIDGSDLRYHPNPHAEYDSCTDQSRVEKFINFLGL